MVESSGHRWKAGEKDEVYKQTIDALRNGDEIALQEIKTEYQGEVEEMKFWSLFNSEQRAAIKALESN